MTNAKRNPRILWVIICLLFIFFAISYGERLATKAYLERTIEEQTNRIALAQQRQQALQQQFIYVRSDAYVEEVARNELGLVQPGDELLMIVEGAPSTAPSSEQLTVPAPVGPPFWQEWLRSLGF
ncbi:MAG: septum formation initiator family protein [Caldilineaceae bacterium]|nr:septum formation initiator family protein [Caldilineaceae bacterium]